jgi:putative ABC transport system permease protein
MSGLLWRASGRHLLGHPWQVGLSILGIALGVAVVVAVDLANESARRAFTGFAESLTGRATHRIVGGPSGVPEEVYARLRRSGVRALAPVVERDVSALAGPGRTLHLFGIDPFVEAPFRSFVTAETWSASMPLAALLTRPATALLAQATAQRMGLQPGDTFLIRAGAERHRLELIGVLIPSDALRARALESLLVTDIATAQEITGATGRLSHVDVVAPPGAAGDALLERIRAALPPAAEIVSASASARALEDLSRGFSVNLTALSLLALFVGVFLVYNTMSFSVVQRRPLIGALRALGVTRREIWILVMTEAFVLGALATAVGLPAGVLLGGGLLRLVTRTINDLYVSVAVSELAVAPATLVVGVALGIGGTLVATLAPALEATRSTPRAALGRSALESRAQALAPRLALGGGALLIAGAALLAVDVRSLVASYAGLFTILLGAALLTPGVTIGIVRLSQPLVGAAFGLLGRMATRGVTAALSRTAVAMAALMIAVAASVGVGIMIDSFRQSVVRWLETSLRADVYVSPPSLVSSRADATLAPDLIARVRATPGVAAVASQRTVRVQSPSGPVNIIVLDEQRAGGGRDAGGGQAPALQRQDAGTQNAQTQDARTQNADMQNAQTQNAQTQNADTQNARTHSARSRGFRAFPLKDGDPATLWRRFGEGEAVVVSEPFAYHRRLGVGDRVRLRTDVGERQFPIGGVVYDYGSSEGVVMMARAAYERFWHDRAISGLGVYAEDPRGIDALIETLRRAAGADQDVFIRSNRALREASLEVFDRTFAVTGVLRLLAMVVAFVGVLSALMAQALERVREIGALRAQGLTPAQVWGLTASQTGFMGLVSGLLALPVGSALALVLIFVINRRSFGWTLQLEIAPAILLQALFLAVGAALLAAVYPAWRMSTMALSAALREE